MLLRGRHYRTGDRVEVTCDCGTVTSVGPATDAKADREAGWIAPALFDLQINGCDGHSFNSANLTRDDVRHVVHTCRKHGIGELCPTLITGSFEALRHGFTTLSQACAAEPELDRALIGFHLEGPYISPEDGPRGAHPLQHVRAPDWDEFQRWQDAAGGRIRLVTLAPEHDGAIGFIEKLVHNGVVVALGHTAAKREHIHAAVAAGARLSTHLGNGCHAMLPRHDNYLWEQLAADELWASLICDGHHLPAALVKCILRVKTPARAILTCDASSLAGLPPGKYRDWDQEFEILPSGKIVVPGTTFLAGSGAFTDLCVGKAMQMAGVSLAEAIDMASARPRELFGLPRRRLESGQPAQLMLFDWEPGGNIQMREGIC
ncbi:MAG: amidohydrolase family protein [Gemmataceae bacterium]|nr:amidohydrolase family protein [Gemmataceae bacterium]